jgi:hypothetical protein
MKNPMATKTTQNQQMTGGDSGGPCFFKETDWQSVVLGDITPRELVGINSTFIRGENASPYDIYYGSSFSTNTHFYKKSIENMTMLSGMNTKKTSSGPKGGGVSWLVDLNVDFG